VKYVEEELRPVLPKAIPILKLKLLIKLTCKLKKLTASELKFALSVLKI